MGTTYRIAEVADRSGFTAATLRYYEDIGLVAPVGRSDAGYRIYDDGSLQRLRFIARAKELGCSLDEIAELTAAWDGGRCAHVQERLRATVEAKVSASRTRIAELTALAAELQRTARALATTAATGACDDSCPCVTAPAPSGAAGGEGGEAACGCGSDASGAVDLVGVGAAGRAPVAMDRGVDGIVLDSRSDGSPAIACTLDPGQMTGRIDDWERLLAPDPDGRTGVVARHAVDGGVRLDLGPDTDVAEVARLAVAEQGCCSFFRFSLSIDGRGVGLEVRAPEQAADLVTALFGAAA